MRFRGTVLLGGKTATGIEVPDDVVTGLGSSRRPAVLVTIRTHTFRSSIAPRGGVFMLPVSAEVRAGAHVAAGDEVDVEVELDHEPREVTVPPDFGALSTPTRPHGRSSTGSPTVIGSATCWRSRTPRRRRQGGDASRLRSAC